jgi:hypothetical protein
MPAPAPIYAHREASYALGLQAVRDSTRERQLYLKGPPQFSSHPDRDSEFKLSYTMVGPCVKKNVRSCAIL